MNTLWIALIAATPPTVAAILAFIRSKENGRAIQEIHLTMNSRLDQLLKAAKGESLAEGRELGRKEKVRK